VLPNAGFLFNSAPDSEAPNSVHALLNIPACWPVASRFILPASGRVILLVFMLVSAALDDENNFEFKWLWY
jgi:hypothetical protein